MCTVSFISKNDTYFITSNRDENIARPLSYRPKAERINGREITYPKDPKAGGTWFATNENGGVAVLLNGAFEKHIPTGSYAMSRGLIVLNIISSENPGQNLRQIDLENIEPFTLLLFENKILLELRWDGSKKHLKELDINKNYIWSSATLYNRESRQQREDLFTEFLQNNKEPRADHIIDFHRNNYDDYENGFVINREDGLTTLSVTQAVIDTKNITLDYLDLLNDKKYSVLVSEQQTLDLLS